MIKWFFVILILLSSCSSYREFQYITEEYEIPNKVFKSDYAQAWQSSLQVLQKYDLAVQNQEAGLIKTRWIDNTSQVNFSDSFDGKDAVKAAKFKIVVNVVKGFRSAREVAKITIFKRQMIERDFLQGWKVVRSDGILEKTLLYRIERVILIDNKLKSIEEKRAKETQETF